MDGRRRERGRRRRQRSGTATVESFDIAQIMRAIPHRYPFLLVDRVVDVVKDVSAIGVKNVSINENFFQGHFPDHPVMPGVLIIESMAQTAAVLVVETLGPEARGKLVYFMTIENAKFRKPVGPRRPDARPCRQGAPARQHLEVPRRRRRWTARSWPKPPTAAMILDR